VANLLVGNPPDSAAIEITLAGPRLRFTRAARIALCGGHVDARCNGQDLPGWRPITLPAGAELELGALRSGCRSYLAVAGGFNVGLLLGSGSTDLRGGFGGYRGRPLQAGDTIGLLADDDPPGAPARAPQIARWWVDPRAELDFDNACVLHVQPGIDRTRPAAALCAQEWTVAAASNRQGLRLQGTPIEPASVHERLSSPVLPGTVQLPPDGQPIVLLADAQTMGGYPRIGQIALADLPRAAQLRPGDRLHLQACSREAAWARLRAQQQRFERMRIAIAARAKPSVPMPR
jgi:biotin-dependent carboxylase-like uncharacterized protein